MTLRTPALLRRLAALALWTFCACARADAVQALRDFVAEARSGQATFTQTVSSSDGTRRRQSAGTFEFQRPDRFRFAYTKPYEQLIVCDGTRVWMYDPGLQQASSRRMGQALAATPAALLAGGDLQRGFDLSPQPPRDGLEWAQAVPKVADGTVQAIRVGFRGRELAALEIIDGFGQRSRLQFADLRLNAPVPAERFRFAPPPGVDVIEQ